MKLELYKDKKGEWRWRLRHQNGRIMADSGEGYTRRVDARKGWERLEKSIMLGKVKEP